METIDELNELLDKAANELKWRRILSPDTFNQLITLANNLSDMFLWLGVELERDRDEFLDFTDNELKVINELEKKNEKLKLKRAEAVQNKDFESAARIRDEMNKIYKEQYQQILTLNGFNEGFNSYKGCLLIVRPKDSLKEHIIEKVVSELRGKSNIN